MSTNQKQLIKKILSKIGIDPSSISVVADSGEPVFEVNTAEKQYFVKILPEHKGRTMEKILGNDIQAGMPSSKLVNTNPYVLLMEGAPGRPLSTYLPICLLPGTWQLTSSGLRECFKMVGNKLGKLHFKTAIGKRSATDEEYRISDRLSVPSNVVSYFDCDTVGALETQLSDKNIFLPVCLIHGDPTPHNIFWNRRSGETTMIDFNLHESVALEDVAIVEVGIELMAGRLPWGQRSQARVLNGAFREGYQLTSTHSSIPITRLQTLKLGYYCHLLDKILRAPQPATTHQQITRFTDRPVLDRLIRTLVDTDNSL